MLDLYNQKSYYFCVGIRVLKYFITVAKEGSITKAANSLHLTQPTLSRQIKEMENELGHQLFIRTNHNVILTPEGLILRKRAEEVIDLLDKAKNEIKTVNKTISGEIFIGSGETNVLKSIADVIKDIRNEYPKIIFHLYSGNLEDVTEKLDRGLLDFGVIMTPCDTSKYDRITLPEKDLWGVVMRKDSPLAIKKVVTLEDLESVPLILARKVFRSYSQNNEFYKWFNEKRDKLEIAATHNLFYNAAVMAERGVGYVLTLNNLVNTSKISSLCFRPLAPSLEVGWDVIWKKNQVFSPAAKLFLEKLQKIYKSYNSN